MSIDHIDDYNVLRSKHTREYDSHRGPKSLDISQVFKEPEQLKLYRGTHGGTKFARVTFMERFAEHLSKISDSNTKQHNDDTIGLEKLVGGEVNLGYYKAAIEEERDSSAFRAAVVMAGVLAYKELVPDWKKPKHLIIGGPSGAGKTFGAKTIIKELFKYSREELLEGMFYGDGHGNPIQYFVTVDGGDSRATSQIRKMVLQCALARGYKGIKDLHKYSKVDIKDQIKTAAMASNVHVVEPRTFAAFGENYNSIVKDSSRVVFCMVETAEDVIQVQGISRAWFDYSREAALMPSDIQINNPDTRCESKEYKAGLCGLYYSMGVNESKRAMNEYWDDEKAGARLQVKVMNNAVVKNGEIDRSIPPAIKLMCKDRWNKEYPIPFEPPMG
jgi:hypothetical protein